MEHRFEFLSLKGGCTGSSESTLVKMPPCWKSYVMALFISNMYCCREIIASSHLLRRVIILFSMLVNFACFLSSADFFSNLNFFGLVAIIMSNRIRSVSPDIHQKCVQKLQADAKVARVKGEVTAIQWGYMPFIAFIYFHKPFPTNIFFCPENVVCLLRLLHIF